MFILAPHPVNHGRLRFAGGEFYTAYTPYQPEVSQGTLQAMFEYQSMICQLTSMDVSNASHYDGATSLAEGVLLALNATKGNRKRVVLSPAVHPHYRSVLRTYTQGMGVSIVGDDNLQADMADPLKLLDSTACLVVQSPNFFGQIENMQGVADAVHAAGPLLIVAADPIGLGLLTPPGEYGADVVVAEGQSLGIPLSYGGVACQMTTARAVIEAAIRNLTSRSGTHIDKGLRLALGELQSERRSERNLPVIVLLTDGIQTGTPGDELRAAVQVRPAGVRLYTVGLGADVDAAVLREMAGVKSRYHFAPDSAALSHIYKEIASDILCPAPSGGFWPGP